MREVNRATSRKFALAVVVLLASVVFVAVGRLSGAEWVAVATLVVGAYSAANVLIRGRNGE